MVNYDKKNNWAGEVYGSDIDSKSNHAGAGVEEGAKSCSCYQRQNASHQRLQKEKIANYLRSLLGFGGWPSVDCCSMLAVIG